METDSRIQSFSEVILPTTEQTARALYHRRIFTSFPCIISSGVVALCRTAFSLSVEAKAGFTGTGFEGFFVGLPTHNSTKLVNSLPTNQQQPPNVMQCNIRRDVGDSWENPWCFLFQISNVSLLLRIRYLVKLAPRNTF